MNSKKNMISLIFIIARVNWNDSETIPLIQDDYQENFLQGAGFILPRAYQSQFYRKYYDKYEQGDKEFRAPL